RAPSGALITPLWIMVGAKTATEPPADSGVVPICAGEDRVNVIDAESAGPEGWELSTMVSYTPARGGIWVARNMTGIFKKMTLFDLKPAPEPAEVRLVLRGAPTNRRSPSALKLIFPKVGSPGKVTICEAFVSSPCTRPEPNPSRSRVVA